MTTVSDAGRDRIASPATMLRTCFSCSVSKVDCNSAKSAHSAATTCVRLQGTALAQLPLWLSGCTQQMRMTPMIWGMWLIS
jgi:hypothetical protein